MTRDQRVRAWRKYARRQGIVLSVDTSKGNGSHYRVKLGDRISTLQKDLNPGRIERFLKQIGLSLSDL